MCASTLTLTPDLAFFHNISFSRHHGQPIVLLVRPLLASFHILSVHGRLSPFFIVVRSFYGYGWGSSCDSISGIFIDYRLNRHP